MKYFHFICIGAALWMLSCNELYAQTFSVSGSVIAAEDGSPLPGATITVKGSTIGTATDADGKYTLKVPDATSVLLVTFLGYIEQEVPVNGLAIVNISLSEDVKQLEEVTIVGSRNANRTKIESPVPVDVISMAPLLASAPQVTVTQILQFVAPSFNSNPTSGGDASSGVNAAQLRGLSVDHVLVLINGKRRYKSALVNLGGAGSGSVGTDLNAIPTGSIDRIEILRDGASAQYGSDAIAGVINIVLKKNVNQLTASGTLGALYLGDGVTTRANANYGFNIGKGYVNVTGEFGTRGITSQAGEYQNQLYGPGGGSSAYSAVYTKQMDDDIMASRGLRRKDFNLRSSPHKQQDALAAFNMALPLGNNNAEFYAFGTTSFRRTENTGVYRYPGQDRNIPQITPDGYLPQIVMSIFDKSLVAGVKGTINKWQVDFFNDFGKNDFKIRVDNSFNVTAGLSSARTFDAGSFNSSMNLTGLELTRFFPNVLDGLNVAYGGQYRVETFNIVPGEDGSTANFGQKSIFNVDTAGGTQYLTNSGIYVSNTLAPGSQVFPGFSNRDQAKAVRSNGAAYFDTELDVTKKWEVSAAVRGETYTDFGNVLTYKVSSRYKIFDKLSLRGSTSTGFRAPDLAQTYFTQVSTNFINGQATDVLTASNVSAAARALGIPKLKQERSSSYALGLSSQPIPNMEITVDAYNIDVKDRIVITGNFSGTSATIPQDLRTALLATGSTQARFFFNGVNTRSQGVEVTGSYKFPIGKGNFTFNAAAVFSRTLIRSVNTPPLLKGQEDIVVNPGDRARIVSGIPQQKVTIMGIYAIGKFSMMLRTVYFGRCITSTQLGAGWYAQNFTSKWITDASLTYKIIPAFSVTVGVNNIFDVYPDKVVATNAADTYTLTSAGRNVYGGVQNGALGGFGFIRLAANIK